MLPFLVLLACIWATCVECTGARSTELFGLRMRKRLAAAFVTATTMLGPCTFAAAGTQGTVQLDDPETISLFKKAISEESDGQFADALRDYQQVQLAPYETFASPTLFKISYVCTGDSGGTNVHHWVGQPR